MPLREYQYVDFVGYPFEMAIGDDVYPINSSMEFFGSHIVAGFTNSTVILVRPYVTLAYDQNGEYCLHGVYGGDVSAWPNVGAETYQIELTDFRREWRIYGCRRGIVYT